AGGEGQWGELPAQPVAMGVARELPRWAKKP
ncbi:mMagnesium chelatase, subunit ChlI, partial [Pseudomonas paraeruginosa]